MSLVLNIQNMTKSYGMVKAIDNLSLQIKPGERVALLGSNGAGKSSFLGVTSGLREADYGKVKVFDKSPNSMKVKEKMGYLPQTLNFPENLSVLEILKLVDSHFKKSSFESLCEKLDLKKLYKRKTYQLSGGEKRKLGLVCTLLSSPEFVILDEPTANIDVEGQKLIEELLIDYFKDNNKALLFSSHQMKEVETLAQRIVVLNKGQIVAEGDTQSIKQKFGLKKVSFSGVSGLEFENAKSQKSLDDKYELYGENSDLMIKEVLQKDPSARDIDISEPALEEILMNLWRNGGEDLCH